MISSMHAGSALTALCTIGLGGFQAAAVSIATVDADGLHYVAAAGAGADRIVGTRMHAGEGIAGFVAATGQSLTVRDVSSDPRFARHVGERTGFVPSTIQCIPVLDGEGDVIAVVSILDRQRADSSGDAGTAPMSTAAFTEVAAALLSSAPTDGGRLAETTTRLDRLSGRDQVRALAVIDTLLDAMER
jgi:signal transduction protein with GAF and PtsI domain